MRLGLSLAVAGRTVYAATPITPFFVSETEKKQPPESRTFPFSRKFSTPIRLWRFHCSFSFLCLFRPDPSRDRWVPGSGRYQSPDVSTPSPVKIKAHRSLPREQLIRSMRINNRFHPFKQPLREKKCAGKRRETGRREPNGDSRDGSSFESAFPPAFHGP